MHRRIRAAIAAAPLVLALTLSGCGSDAGSGDDGDDGVASVTGESQESGGSGSSEKAPTEEELNEAALEFAECMREHGIEMEDPKPGEGIRLEVTKESRDEMEQAMAACQDIMPKAPAKSPEEEREDMLAMAKCMRENGVDAFPDPKPGEGIKIGPEVAEDPDFEPAQEKCSENMRGPRIEASQS